MTMTTLAEDYTKIRQQHDGMGAINAFRWAKQKQEEKTREYDGSDIANGPVKLTRGKFSIHISAEIDESPDHSYLGEYSDTWQEGAIRNPESVYNHGVYKWWIPCNTEDGHYKSLRDMKYGKSLARELAHSYVLQDMKTMKDLQSYIVMVRVYVNGIELGSDVLGGVDISDDIDYLADTIDENGMIDNAIEEAKTALTGLCETE